MKQLFTLFILSFILFSCSKSTDKDENYTLKGQVVDFDNNSPIAGAKVYVAENGFPLKIVDSAVTDTNGNVSFTYRKEGNF